MAFLLALPTGFVPLADSQAASPTDDSALLRPHTVLLVLADQVLLGLIKFANSGVDVALGGDMAGVGAADGGHGTVFPRCEMGSGVHPHTTRRPSISNVFSQTPDQHSDWPQPGVLAPMSAAMGCSGSSESMGRYPKERAAKPSAPKPKPKNKYQKAKQSSPSP